jgi:hypothetical protein
MDSLGYISFVMRTQLAPMIACLAIGTGCGSIGQDHGSAGRSSSGDSMSADRKRLEISISPAEVERRKKLAASVSSRLPKHVGEAEAVVKGSLVSRWTVAPQDLEDIMSAKIGNVRLEMRKLLYTGGIDIDFDFAMLRIESILKGDPTTRKVNSRRAYYSPELEPMEVILIRKDPEPFGLQPEGIFFLNSSYKEHRVFAWVSSEYEEEVKRAVTLRATEGNSHKTR